MTMTDTRRAEIAASLGIKTRVKTFDPSKMADHQLLNISSMEHASPEKRAACDAELEARAKRAEKA